MVRIFFGLVVVALVMLVANLVLGLMVGPLSTARFGLNPHAARLRELENQHPRSVSELAAAREAWKEAAESVRPLESRAFIHVMVGVVVTLLAILVSCVGVTYFVGTSRWCREVSEAYGLPPELADKSARLKRQAFPWAVGMFLVLMGNACLGMIDYRDAGRTAVNAWSTWHLLSALFSVAFVALALFVQYTKVAANSCVIGEVMNEVHRIRAARGLPLEDA